MQVQGLFRVEVSQELFDESHDVFPFFNSLNNSGTPGQSLFEGVFESSTSNEHRETATFRLMYGEIHPDMEVGIAELPVELLTQILDDLDTQSVKSARSVCRRWSNTAGRNLFHKIYFTPLPEAMEMFTRITTDRFFAPGVAEIVYDARLFCLHSDERDLYHSAFASYHNPQPNEANHHGYIQRRDRADRSRRLYGDDFMFAKSFRPKIGDSEKLTHELCQSQEATVKSGLAYKTLQAGLQHLPNFCELTICDHPVSFLDSVALSRMNSRWIDSIIDKLIGDSVPPRLLWKARNKYGCCKNTCLMWFEDSWLYLNNLLPALIVSFSALTSCEIRGLTVEASALEVHLSRHRHTLRQLKLSDITLLQKHWETLAFNLGSSLSLDIVQVEFCTARRAKLQGRPDLLENIVNKLMRSTTIEKRSTRLFDLGEMYGAISYRKECEPSALAMKGVDGSSGESESAVRDYLLHGQGIGSTVDRDRHHIRDKKSLTIARYMAAC